MHIHTINPATEKIIKEYKTLDTDEIYALIRRGHEVFLLWQESLFSERKKLMLNLSELLIQDKKTFSKLITEEMGKPLLQSQSEIEKCAWLCRFYAEEAENFLKAKIIKTEMKEAKVCYQPLGLILGIMPWNYPFWQVFRFAVPTIMAGNSVILKHAPISTGAGAAIEELFKKAGFPKYLFQQAIVNSDLAAQILINPQVMALSFTGSAHTGKILASLAASHLKKSVMELGGNDPYIICKDADLDLAAQNIVTSRLNNCGQVCIAAKRIIVDKAIYDELLQKIIKLMKNYVSGDPKNAETLLGPMAREDLREVLHQQVSESIENGAKLVIGGIIPHQKGFYYPPTLLTEVKPGMPAFDEELFGPVISLIKVSSEDEALALANQSEYGLSAAVFTKSEARGEKLAAKLSVGTCFINSMVSSDPRLPFGGIKHSGFGRELAQEGILEFVNIKSIAIK